MPKAEGTGSGPVGGSGPDCATGRSDFRRSSSSNPSGDSSRPAASLTSRLRPSRATTAGRCSPAASRYASRAAPAPPRVTREEFRLRRSPRPRRAGPRDAVRTRRTVWRPPSPCPGSVRLRRPTGTLTAEMSCHRSRKCSGPCTPARRTVRRAWAALLWPTTCSERSRRRRATGTNPVAHSTRSRSSVRTSDACPVSRAGAIRSNTGRVAASRGDSGGRTECRGAGSCTSWRTPKNRARRHAATMSSGTSSGSRCSIRNCRRASRSVQRARGGRRDALRWSRRRSPYRERLNAQQLVTCPTQCLLLRHPDCEFPYMILNSRRLFSFPGAFPVHTVGPMS
ncbi:hypothetical protein SALBM311S_01264 [Streptomyces alboniger]